MTNDLECDLHRPARLKQLLEAIGLRQVRPVDITENVEGLYQTYADLAGDRDIGPGDSDGHCQDWQNDPGWWKRMPGMPNGRRK